MRFFFLIGEVSVAAKEIEPSCECVRGARRELHPHLELQSGDDVRVRHMDRIVLPL